MTPGFGPRSWAEGSTMCRNGKASSQAHGFRGRPRVGHIGEEGYGVQAFGGRFNHAQPHLGPISFPREAPE